MVVPRCRK